MATEARKFQVGLFVLSAATIAVGAAIWLGASRYFADEIAMVTYFSESVQGLDPGSDVKYRGVPAGRVETIRIAPDGELIEVVLSVKSSVADVFREDQTLRAQLNLSGITGLRYVEIDRHSGEALNRSPGLSFAAPYEVVRSTPSSFMAIQEALQEVYDSVMSVDLEGISSDTRATLQAADLILRDDRVQRTLTSLAELSESASRVTANVEDITRNVELADAVSELRKTTAEARAFLQELRSQRVGESVHLALSDISNLTRATQELVIGLQSTIERLDRSVTSFRQLTNEVGRQPSRLLFSDPPPPRRAADGPLP